MSTYSENHTDFDDADRGFIATLGSGQIRNSAGEVVFDLSARDFLTGEAPDTVHPGLWRQSKLTAKHGLFEVVPGVYQVRGFDLSNMTLVEGDEGVIVIDPLVTAETAAAGLALYRHHRGERPVTAVIYTHAHGDHFGGVLGVVDPDTAVPIIAPEHFMEHAVSENVYAGIAMLRRGVYYGGATLPLAPDGAVGVGLGPGASTGSLALLAPTLEITTTGQEEVIDGVRIVFQMTPNTESPAEMNFFFPDLRTLCMAENTTHTMHNLLTLRGAQVRDPRIWSRYIAEAIELFAPEADVVIASHHWPIWGTESLLEFLRRQRDLYAFMNDQVLRLINQGYTGTEIAEILEAPGGEHAAFDVHGYYGSLSHNAKAVYQRYLGWYDGNPAHLWLHTPHDQAERYTDLLGGVDAVIAHARRYAQDGDLRFAAELASHAVFADASSEAAKTTLADILEQLGFGAENATWRNAYLTGAHELRHGVKDTPLSNAGMLNALTITQLFDTVAIRLDASRAMDESISVRWQFTDTDEVYRMELSNGALVHFPTVRSQSADLTVTLTREQLLKVLATGSLSDVESTGDVGAVSRILSFVDSPDPSFPVVTP